MALNWNRPATMGSGHLLGTIRLLANRRTYSRTFMGLVREARSRADLEGEILVDFPYLLESVFKAIRDWELRRLLVAMIEDDLGAEGPFWDACLERGMDEGGVGKVIKRAVMIHNQLKRWE